METVKRSFSLKCGFQKIKVLHGTSNETLHWINCKKSIPANWIEILNLGSIYRCNASVPDLNAGALISGVANPPLKGGDGTRQPDQWQVWGLWHTTTAQWFPSCPSWAYKHLQIQIPASGLAKPSLCLQADKPSSSGWQSSVVS